MARKQAETQTQVVASTANLAGEWIVGVTDAPAEVLADITPRGVKDMGKLKDSRLMSIAIAGARMEKAGQWAIADTACELATRHEGSEAKVYSEIAEKAGLTQQYVENLASAARKVSFALRRGELSITHHVEVSIAGLTDDMRRNALDSAVQGKWTVAQLREYVREIRPDTGKVGQGAGTVKAKATRGPRLPIGPVKDVPTATESVMQRVSTPEVANLMGERMAAPTAKAPNPSVVAQSQDTGRALVIGRDVSAQFIAMCGSVEKAEAKAAEILGEWLSANATVNRTGRLDVRQEVVSVA